MSPAPWVRPKDPGGGLVILANSVNHWFSRWTGIGLRVAGREVYEKGQAAVSLDRRADHGID